MANIVLLGSAFLPSEVMEPLADALHGLGHMVDVAAPWEPADADEALHVYEAALRDRPAPILIGYSNAGNYIAPLADRHELSGAVFMDGALPPLEGGDWRVVPAELAEYVAQLSGDRAAPRWTRWWSADEMRVVFPGDAAFRAVDATAPRVPKSYLASELHASPTWTQGLALGCLAFGDTYAAELVRAEAHGWPVEVLELGHVGMLGSPGLVAAAIQRLINRLVVA